MNMLTLLLSVGLATLSVAYADEPTRSTSAPKSTISISGRGGGPITVTDKRDANPRPVEVVPRPVNQSSLQAQERAAAARMAAEEAARQRREEREAQRQAILGEAAADAEAAEEDAKKAAEEKEKELTPEEGLKLLREKNFITYTEDDKHYPEVVFDPFGKEFIPTAEAVKRLQNPPQPGVPGGKPTTP